MLARVYSCAVIGLEGVVVEVEVDYSNGLPAVIIVGLPDAAHARTRGADLTPPRSASEYRRPGRSDALASLGARPDSTSQNHCAGVLANT